MKTNIDKVDIFGCFEHFASPITVGKLGQFFLSFLIREFIARMISIPAH